MVTLVRLEAEGKTLAEVVKALDAQKVPSELHVHDEHYERVTNALFKGRRVYRQGEKSPGVNDLKVTMYPPTVLTTSGTPGWQNNNTTNVL